MKPTLDTKVRRAQGAAEELEKATSGPASRLAYSLRQELDDIVDEVDRMTYEYAVQYRNDYSNGWRFVEEINPRWGGMSGVDAWLATRDEELDGETLRVVQRLVSEPEVME